MFLILAGRAEAENTWIDTYGWTDMPSQTKNGTILNIFPINVNDFLLVGLTESHGFGGNDGWVAKVVASNNECPGFSPIIG
jgi:hypothetical protein